MLVLIRKYFKKQEKRVLPTVKSEVNFNFDLAKETTKAKMDFTPFIKDVVAKYGDEAFAFLGLTGFDNNTNNVRSFLKKDGLEFAKGINKTTKTRISSAIADGVDAGESIVGIRNRVRNVYKQASTTRAMTIAKTEVARASVFATVEGYKQSKVVKGKEWLTEFSQNTCDLCSSMHGEVVGINESFSLGGDPPNVTHPNCQCLVLPVLKEGDIPTSIKPTTKPIEWKPSMTQARADKWTKDSKFKKPIYHGTNSDAAKSIAKGGFRISESGAFGRGVYLTPDRKGATVYSQLVTMATGGKKKPAVLNLRTNIKRIKRFKNQGVYDKELSKFKKVMNIKTTNKALLRFNKKLGKNYDAIVVKDSNYYVIFNPKNITTIK